MEVRLVEDATRCSIEIQVLCPPQSVAATRLAERIRALTGRISGYEEGRVEQRVVELADIALFDIGAGAVRILLRTGATLETPRRLYEIETALEGTEFVRVSRQAIVNFDAIRAIRPELNGRLELELEGGATTLVTRLYAPSIRQKLGIIGR